MRLEVVSHQISLVGKNKEAKKIEQTLNAFHAYLFGEQCANGDLFDNGDEECDLVDLGFAYCQQDFTTAEVAKLWKEFKLQQKAAH